MILQQQNVAKFSIYEHRLPAHIFSHLQESPKSFQLRYTLQQYISTHFGSKFTIVKITESIGHFSQEKIQGLRFSIFTYGS